MKLQQTLFDILEPNRRRPISIIVNAFIFFWIILTTISVILQTFPLTVELLTLIYYIEKFALATFTIEYLIRIYIAPLSYPECSKLKGRIKYILSLGGIIDLLAILPFLLPFIFNMDLAALRILRAFRFIRIFKATRYIKSIKIFTNVLKKSAWQLFTTFMIFLILILFSALIFYEFEHAAQPDTVATLFDAMYLMIVSVTTVGYGDITPITTYGRILSTLTIILGVGIVALPTGILSAGYYEELSKVNHDGEDYKGEPNNQSDYKYCPHCGEKLK